MAPQTRKDIRYPQPLLDRIADLAKRKGEEENTLIRRATEMGVDQMESEVARHLAYLNAIGVNAKLNRRGDAQSQAIARLSNGEPVTGQEALHLAALLREAAGG